MWVWHVSSVLKAARLFFSLGVQAQAVMAMRLTPSPNLLYCSALHRSLWDWVLQAHCLGLWVLYYGLLLTAVAMPSLSSYSQITFLSHPHVKFDPPPDSSDLPFLVFLLPLSLFKRLSVFVLVCFPHWPFRFLRQGLWIVCYWCHAAAENAASIAQVLLWTWSCCWSARCVAALELLRPVEKL